MSVSFAHPAPGVSTICFAATGLSFRYRVDALGHQVVVTGEGGEIVRVFGGYGRAAGSFDTPLDVVFVRPEFAGEHLPHDSADAVWLAVADYGNRRVQVFELDGTPVGEFPVEGPQGGPWTPTGLSWRSPVLEVEGLDGASTAVHLSAALLAGSGGTSAPRSLPFVSEARH